MARDKLNAWIFEAFRHLPRAKWTVCGHEVRSSAQWCSLLGLTRKRVLRLQAHYRAGGTCAPEDGRSFSTREYTRDATERTDTFFHWLHTHLAEPMPDGPQA